jgi:hypothetical protein
MIVLIAIVLGALAGAAAGGEAGALAGALFGWLIVRSLRQQREIEALRKCADVPVSAAAWRDARSERESIEQGLDGATPSTAAASNGGVTPGAGGRGAVLANDIAPIAAAVASTSASAIAPARASAYAPTSATAVAPSSAAAAPNTVSGTPAGVAKSAGNGVRAAPPRDLLEPIRRWLFGGNTSSRPASASSSSASPFSPSTRASTRTCRSNIAWPPSARPPSFCSASAGACAWPVRTTRKSCRAARSPSSI